MTPTNELRFVERPVQIAGVDPSIKRTVRVLQQKWIEYRYNGEVLGVVWRDVPLEKETP